MFILSAEKSNLVEKPIVVEASKISIIPADDNIQRLKLQRINCKCIFFGTFSELL